MSHLNSHNGTKAFECQICGKKLASQASLVLHQRYDFLSVLQRYLCFSSDVSNLRLHTGQRPYSCQQCGKQFRHRSYFKVHLQAHQRSSKGKTKSAKRSEEPTMENGGRKADSNIRVTLAEPLELTESGNLL